MGMPPPVFRRLAAAVAASLLLAAPLLGAEALRPAARFHLAGAPAAPLYSADRNWAALPGRADGADVAPPGATDDQAGAAVDVFFVHPTTHLLGPWNAAADDPGAATLTDEFTLRNQASVFDSAGRVYAPRYRQAALYAYTHHDADSLAARELAYSDVARAFDAFLERNGTRPFLLAGHSQGAHHLLRLLEERFAGPGLRRRLVAAYLIGVPMPADKLDRTLHGIPLCDDAAQTGCIVSWNTVAPGADRTRFREIRHHYPTGWESNEGKPLACVNPLSWRAGGGPAPATLPLAAVPRSRKGALRRAPGPREASCADGLLEVELPRNPHFRLTRGRRGDYHAYDFSLFHMNLRHNATARVAAFLAPG